MARCRDSVIIKVRRSTLKAWVASSRLDRCRRQRMARPSSKPLRGVCVRHMPTASAPKRRHYRRDPRRTIACRPARGERHRSVACQLQQRIGKRSRHPPDSRTAGEQTAQSRRDAQEGCRLSMRQGAYRGRVRAHDGGRPATHANPRECRRHTAMRSYRRIPSVGSTNEHDGC